MKLVHTRALVAIAALAVGAPAPGAQAQSAPERKGRDGQTPITLVGCIERESEYRRVTGSGTGGVGGFGVGLGDEFVLIAARRSGTTTPTAPVARQGSTVNDIAAAKSSCGASSGGEAFELTGSKERELGRFVGQQVEVVGVLKPGKDAPAGTSGTETRTDTTGLSKLNPWGQDLHLQEVEVTSFQPSSR